MIFFGLEPTLKNQIESGSCPECDFKRTSQATLPRTEIAMRVLIAEQAHVGHYYTYVRYLLQAVRPLRAEVVLAVTPEGRASEEFQIHLSESVEGVEIRPILHPVRIGARGIIAAVLNLRRVCNEVRPDVLYIPSGDWIGQSAGLARMAGLSPVPRHIHSECLINRLSFTYPEYGKSALVQSLSLAALRNSPWTKIHLTDTLAFDWLQRSVGANPRYTLTPDPIEEFPPLTHAQARQILKIPEDGRYLVCAGVLDSRKGIGPLLAAFSSAALSSADRLLLAGPLAPDVRQLLDSPASAALINSDRLLIIDRVLSTAEISTVTSAGNVIACAYPKQPHPVSMAIRALSRNRPIIGSDNYWLGRMVPKYHMGWTVNVADAEAFAAIIPHALDASSDWTRSEPAGELVKFASVENFKACWVAGLRARV
jgi:glycosyltransferase involved in cell wall biosynthesis